MWNKHGRESERDNSSAGNAALIVAALEHEGGGIEMVFSVERWKDPSTWGILLADLARHVGDAYEQAHGLRADVTIARVLEVFQKEMRNPTDQTRGHLHHPLQRFDNGWSGELKN